jgi:hypothetical protein
MTARRVSPLLRLVWATTALITVWCLGCSAFDPLFALLGGSSTPPMLCASEGGAAPDPGSAVAAASSNAPTSSVAATSSMTARGETCGCQSCFAPQAERSPAHARAQSTPRVDRVEPTTPASVTRSPLLPPPERVA